MNCAFSELYNLIENNVWCIHGHDHFHFNDITQIGNKYGQGVKYEQEGRGKYEAVSQHEEKGDEHHNIKKYIYIVFVRIQETRNVACGLQIHWCNRMPGTTLW